MRVQLVVIAARMREAVEHGLVQATVTKAVVEAVSERVLLPLTRGRRSARPRLIWSAARAWRDW